MKNLLVALFLLGGTALLAQKGSVRGNVFDKETGEPIEGAIVSAVGTGNGTSTDEQGFYALAGLEPGQVTIKVTYIGYDADSAEVTSIAGKASNKSFYLVESVNEISAVEISAEKLAKKLEVKASVVTITPKDIKIIPAVGGTADLAQYLQVLPGVVFTGDQGGQLYIRGGAPVNNRVLLDGITIYNPFHSIGFYSVFETDVIRSADVYTGGFGAEFGGRTGAVIDVKTRDGNKKRIAGKIEASPFMAKAILEGPIIPLNTKGNSLSYLLTAKHSYLDQTSKTIYGYVNENGLPFNFSDFFGKVSFNAGNGSRISGLGFSYNDAVDVEGVASYNWKTYGGGANFHLVPGMSKIMINGTFAYSNYVAELKEGDETARRSEVGAFNSILEFQNFIDKGEVRYGVEISGIRTVYGNEDNTTEMGFYVRGRKKLGHIVIDPSVRMMYYSSIGAFSFEPRMGFKWNVTDKFRFKMAGGYYTQNLLSTVSERDIVNFFTGYFTSPSEVYKPGTNTPVKYKWQNSWHAIAGFEVDLPLDIELNVEPYYKYSPQVINVNRNIVFVTDPDYVSETGDAYGIDVLAKYNKNNLYLYLAYSLGYVTRNDGEQTYYTHFDRRHNLNLVASYGFGHAKGKERKPWEVSVRWNLGSGFAFTRTQGFYQQFPFTDGIASDPVTDGNNLGILYEGDRNVGRLPYYHRLDLSIKRFVEFSKNLKMEITAGLTNAYDRENIFYFDRVRYTRVNQLPILPSLAMSFTF